MQNTMNGSYNRDQTMISVIKTAQEYHAVLEEIERLIDTHPTTGSAESDRLELLAVLAKEYEVSRVKIPAPDPVSAILFRMEQQNLTQRDLVPFIGSRSKVSEVLSGKRGLSLSMIRALHRGLDIPVDVLVQGEHRSGVAEQPIDWKLFPINEMIKRGWLELKPNDTAAKSAMAVKELLSSLMPLHNLTYVQFRKGQYTRSSRRMDDYALMAWTARVAQRANAEYTPTEFQEGSLTLEAMRELVKCSVYDDGPLRAGRILQQIGVTMIVEPHLPNTYLDGAAIMIDKRKPIVGLTLRHDRIDSFWFCLMHELSHISLHLRANLKEIFDNLDVPDTDNIIETEADNLASEFLIPHKVWDGSPASKLKSPDAAEHLAKKLGIHPAIVAGRMRKEFNAYQLLNRLVGHNQVRVLFTNVDWSKF